MAELPYFQFYPADYLRDTEILTLSAQGGWTRMLCSMWHPSRRGVLSLRLQAMARLLHASEEATKSIIEEIEDCGVGDVEWGNDGRVSVTCRRMVRDWEAAEAKRQALSEAGRKGGKAKRKPPPSQAKATLKPGLSEAEAKAEARSQKPEDLSKSSSPPPQSPPAGGGCVVVEFEAESSADLESIIAQIAAAYETKPTRVSSEARRAFLDDHRKEPFEPEEIERVCQFIRDHREGKFGENAARIATTPSAALSNLPALVTRAYTEMPPSVTRGRNAGTLNAGRSSTAHLIKRG